MCGGGGCRSLLTISLCTYEATSGKNSGFNSRLFIFQGPFLSTLTFLPFLSLYLVSSFSFPFFVCVICSDVLAQLTLELHFGINSYNNFFKEGYFLMFRIVVGQEICLWMKS